MFGGLDSTICEGTRTCSHCSVTFPITHFYRSTDYKDGRLRKCKTCLATQKKEYRTRLSDRTTIPIPPNKTCAKCRILRPSSDFAPVSSAPDGLNRLCHTCANTHNLRNRQVRMERDPVNEKLRTMAIVAKGRAKSYDVPFNLTFSYMVHMFRHVTHCPMLGMKLTWGNLGYPMSNSPSLDRIVPQLGYVEGNVQIISFLANTFKRDATLMELQTFAISALGLVSQQTLKFAQFYRDAIPTPLPQLAEDIAAKYRP